jgi:hypothetical protein
MNKGSLRALAFPLHSASTTTRPPPTTTPTRLTARPQRMDEGGLRAPPPSVARLQMALQEAMAAFGQAAKLSATQFPFPWAQASVRTIVSGNIKTAQV